MRELTVTFDDKFANQVIDYAKHHNTSFHEITQKMWIELLNNDLSINSEQQQILAQRLLNIQNGNADLIDHSEMMGRLKNRVVNNMINNRY